MACKKMHLRFTVLQLLIALCCLKSYVAIALFELNDKSPEIKGGVSHECYRNCTDGGYKTCHYNFTLMSYSTMSYQCKKCPMVLEDCYSDACLSADGYPRLVAIVNMMLPGPSIQVCEGDTVVVNVENSFMAENAAIHWHGIHQVGTPFYDGVPFITQCPILPGQNFQYKFAASPAGTHMWHSHVGFQEADGMFGSFVIRKANDPSSYLYDYDMAEHVITIWHWYHQMTGSVLKPILYKYGGVHGHNLLINGLASGQPYFNSKNETVYTPKQVFKVSSGNRYRFRVIFNGAIYCPVQMSIDDHKLLMIASETGQFDPTEVESFIITGGERFDFVLKTDQPPKNYWIRFRGMGDCDKGHAHVSQLAVLQYTDSNDTTVNHNYVSNYEDSKRGGPLLNPIEVSKQTYPNNTIIKLTDLNNVEANPANVSGTPDYTFYFAFVFNTYHDFYAPGPYPQMNNVSFAFPNFPLLTQSNQITENTYCTATNKDAEVCKAKFCHCPYVYPVKKNSLVEVVFTDLTFDRDQDHPMHLHGHEFYVVAMDTVGVNITFEDIKSSNEMGLLKKNLETPLAKDNVNIPAKGYTIVRFNATNPGYWFFHCHVANHLEMGMGAVIKVGENEEMAKPPASFPKCGPRSSNGNVRQHLTMALLPITYFIVHLL